MRQLPPELRQRLAGAEVAVHDVPDAAEEVLLAAWDEQHRALKVYRRPCELRAGSRAELMEVIRDAILGAFDGL